MPTQSPLRLELTTHLLASARCLRPSLPSATSARAARENCRPGRTASATGTV